VAGDVPPPSAASNPPPERITLAYSAPLECPQEEAFRAAVRERASGDWEAAPGELARRIDVSVSRSGERFVAAIVFLNPQGERITRSFSGKACSDVVDGSALVTALAIQARVGDALAQSEPDPALPKPPSAAPSPEPAALPPAPRVTAPARELRVRFGVAAHVASGVGPEPSFGPAAWGVLEWRRSRVGLGVSALFSGEVTANGVPAHYRRVSGRLDACPYVVGSTTFAFEPCAFFDAGALHGEGVASAGLTSTSGGAAPWLVPGLLFRVVAGLGPFVVDAELGGGPPLLRERFGVVQDGHERTTFRVPAFVIEGGVGVGLRL
jgi:hypothetical protein